MAEHVRAQVGDHALAQPVHGVHARRAGQRQHQADADQRDEIVVDEDAVVRRQKPTIDHAPHGHRHRQHGRGRDDQGHERRRHHAPGSGRGRATAPAAGAAWRRGRGGVSAFWSALDNGRPSRCGREAGTESAGAGAARASGPCAPRPRADADNGRGGSLSRPALFQYEGPTTIRRPPAAGGSGRREPDLARSPMKKIEDFHPDYHRSRW